MGNISQTVRDREFVSTEGHYKVLYRLTNEGEIFDLRWPWKVKVTNRNLRCGISRKWYEIESSYQQKVIIKSHISFSKKVEIFDLRWPWKVKVTNRKLRWGISRKRYAIESSTVRINRRPLWSPILASQKRWNIWPLVTLKGQGDLTISWMRNISQMMRDRVCINGRSL